MRKILSNLELETIGPILTIDFKSISFNDDFEQNKRISIDSNHSIRLMTFQEKIYDTLKFLFLPFLRDRKINFPLGRKLISS